MSEMASIKECVRTILAAGRVMPAGKGVILPPCIWGPHGVAKSASISRLAFEEGIGFLDVRLSQMEGVDLRGMPIIQDMTTQYARPLELPGFSDDTITCDELVAARLELEALRDELDPLAMQYGVTTEIMTARRKAQTLLRKIAETQQRVSTMESKCERGILLLDEWNQADRSVLNACFQLVYDRSVGTFQLHPGWDIVLLANPPGPRYDVAPMNVPLADRMVHLFVHPGDALKQDWMQYVGEKYEEEAASVVSFVNESNARLFGKHAVDYSEVYDTIDPTLRSMEYLLCIDIAAKQLNQPEEIRARCISGLIGTEHARSYMLNAGLPVMPSELLTNGVAHYVDKLSKFTSSQTQSLCMLLGYASREKIRSNAVVAVILDFSEWVLENSHVPDAAIGMLKIVSQADSTFGNNRIGNEKLRNPDLVEILAACGDQSPLTTELVKRPRLCEILHDTVNFDPRTDLPNAKTTDPEEDQEPKMKVRRRKLRTKR